MPASSWQRQKCQVLPFSTRRFSPLNCPCLFLLYLLHLLPPFLSLPALLLCSLHLPRGGASGNFAFRHGRRPRNTWRCRFLTYQAHFGQQEWRQDRGGGSYTHACVCVCIGYVCVSVHLECFWVMGVQRASQTWPGRSSSRLPGSPDPLRQPKDTLLSL